MIAMRAAERLLDNIVDHAEPEEIFGCEFQRFRRFVFEVAAFPQDAGATFRTDHAVVRMFEHSDPVADTDTDCAARPAFANDNTDNRRAQGRHFEHRFRDRLRDPALFGRYSRVGARRVDETNDRQSEFRGESHFGACFSVPFGVRASEMA